MKILYDNQIFIAQKFGGISRYFFELINKRNNLYDYEIPLIYTDNEYSKILGINKEFPIKFSFKGKYKITNFLNKYNNKKIINIKNYDIFHPTYYNTIYLNYIKDIPFVIDVHDMIYEIFPEYNDSKIINSKKEYFLKANRIISNSNKTKEDLMHFIPELNPNKIIVIYRGEVFKNIKYISNSEKQKYILFTGQRSGYKNFINFIKAVSEILIQFDLKLICTGSKFSNSELKLLNEHNILDRVNSLFLSENELQNIYANALLFVFPSLYEGFGFPILEAFSSGCPALLSNESCFPEIAGDAAVYFNPYSVEDMKEKIEDVITNNYLQKSLIEKGFERLKFYSWENTIKQTYQLYSDVLSNVQY